jgi:Tat protein secretion system quality control protein TatD with DNase activity
MKFIDTHCHIHEDTFAFEPDETITRAKAAGVEKLIVVGTSTADSANTVARRRVGPAVMAVQAVEVAPFVMPVEVPPAAPLAVEDAPKPDA